MDERELDAVRPEQPFSEVLVLSYLAPCSDALWPVVARCPPPPRGDTFALWWSALAVIDVTVGCAQLEL